MLNLHASATEAIVAREPAVAAALSPRTLRQRLRSRARSHETHALNKLFRDHSFRPFRVY